LNEYITQLEDEEKIKKRAGSDSSGAISSGAEDNMGDDRSQSTDAMVDADVQESGGDPRGFLKVNVPGLEWKPY